MNVPALLFRKLVVTAAALVLGGGVWMGVVASTRGLAESWREAIRGEFAKQGIVLSLGRLTLDPIHGLVARDVRLYDDADQQSILAEVSRIDLDVSVPRLFRKQVSLNRIHVRNAEVSIPLRPDQPAGERLRVEQFNARVLLGNDRVEVQEMRGRLFGVLCSLTGELVRRPSAGGRRPGGARPGAPQGLGRLPADRARMVEGLVRTLGQLKWERGKPAELQVRATADLENLEEGTFEFSFQAPVLAWEQIRVEDVRVRGRYEAGYLQAEDVRFHDAAGPFRAEADFVRGTRMLRFNVESQAATPEALRRRWWPESWPRLEVAGAPRVEAGGTMTLPDGKAPWRFEGLITGTLALGAFSLDDRPYDYASASFAAAADRLLVRDLRIRSGDDTAQGTLAYENGTLSVRGSADGRPENWASLAPDRETRRVLAAFVCGDDSVHRITFAVAGRPEDRHSWVLDASFEAERVRFNGMPVARARAGLAVSHGLVRFTDCMLEIPAGAPLVAREGVTPGPTRASAREVRVRPPPENSTSFDGLECSGWPYTVMAAFVPVTARHLPRIGLNTPARITVEGRVTHDLAKDTLLRFQTSSEGVLLYPFLGRDLPLQAPRASFVLKGNQLEIPSVRAGFLGGTAEASFVFTGLGRGYPASRGRIATQGTSYQDLMALFNSRAESARGTLDLDFTFSQDKPGPGTLNGDGRMALRDGDLFAIPLFGPLSPLVEAVLPNLGIGYSVASSATATYAIRNSVLTTDDFTALTPAFKMDGRGTVQIDTRAVDFNARLNARGIAQVATAVFSYIFEYKCEGTLDEPKWRPLRIPRIPLPPLPKPQKLLPKLIPPLPKLTNPLEGITLPWSKKPAPAPPAQPPTPAKP